MIIQLKLQMHFETKISRNRHNCRVQSVEGGYAMQKNQVSEAHFAQTTGYGYNDLGRDTLEKVYADIFHTEDALVRPQ